MSHASIHEKCKKAEESLRIYIYPIPAEAGRAKLDQQILGHFQMEQEFFRFIRKEKKITITEDPEKANAFFIDHHMLHLSSQRQSCSDIHKHLTAISNNVVDRLPYYNKSQGKDHFFFSVYDHGPFCEHVCQTDKEYADGITNAMSKIEGTNFIGNFGMDDANGDKKYHQSYSQVTGALCHRVGKDIVIPQLFGQSMDHYRRKYPYTGILERQFDSSFSGSFWGERVPVLMTMSKYRFIDTY